MGDNLRLDRILGNMGYGTRKQVKKYIRAGLVKVDSKIVKKSSLHINPYESNIEINGETVEYRDYVYIMMNKPQGVISATHDEVHETVLDIIDESYRVFDLFPMGRLDIDTEGLLILTNDGKLSHEILSPNNHIPKTYYAHIDGVISEDDILEFSNGIILDDGYKTLPGKLKVIGSGQVSEIELTIYEGKFHQVKRMFSAINKNVVYLKRIAMGELELDNSLELGDYRELSEDELDVLRERSKS